MADRANLPSGLLSRWKLVTTGPPPTPAWGAGRQQRLSGSQGSATALGRLSWLLSPLGPALAQARGVHSAGGPGLSPSLSPKPGHLCPPPGRERRGLREPRPGRGQVSPSARGQVQRRGAVAR